MKYLLLLFIFFLEITNSPIFAQKKGEAFLVSGCVADSLSETPESYATVRILSGEKKQPIKVVTTDVSGKFQVAVPHSGSYTLQLSALGKETKVKTLNIEKEKHVQLGILFLQESSTTLGTATVLAQRPIVKAEVDRISYSMKEDPDAKTNNLLDMLRKVPMVTVDGEDQIQVNGNTSFKVYVNGKPNEMMSSNASLIMKNYPASMVKKIEVITDPGAKYDAEGLAGILNIVTDFETQTKGYALSPNIGFSNRGIKGGALGMFQLGKFMFSANYGIGQRKSPTSSSQTERKVFHDAVNHFLTSEGISKKNALYQYGGFDGSYEYDKQNLFTCNVGFYSNKGDHKGNTLYQMFNEAGEKIYSYNILKNVDSRYLSLDAGADYQHTFKKPGQMLTFSYRMNTAPNSNRSYNSYTDIVSVPFDLHDLYIDPDNKTTEHTVQVDFTMPFGNKHTFSTGIKYINRLNNSDNVEKTRVSGSDNTYEVDDETSLVYRHRNDITALYAEYGLKLDAFSVRTGLRYEYSNVKVSYPDGKRDKFDSNFSDLVPTINLAYNITPTQMLKAGYNMRIGRPSILYLSPYVQHENPQSITYGQPNLKSERGHNLSVGYSLFGPKFSINSTLSYAISNNGLATYSFVEDGVQHTTYANALHSKVTNLNVYINWMIVKGTSLNVNSNVSYSDFKTYKTNDNNSGFNGGFWGGLRQNLPWKMKFGIWGGYGSGRINLQGDNSSYHYYSVNLSRSFLKDDALTITLNAANIFEGDNRMVTNTATDSFCFHGVSKYNMSRYGINFSYNLGKLKKKVRKTARTIVNTDVIAGGGEEKETGEPGGHKGM